MSAYAWEGLVERSWDTLVEDDDGVLRTLDTKGDAHSERNAKVRLLADLGKDGPICRRMIRYVCVVVDMSHAMVNHVLRINLETFILANLFFDLV